MSSPQLLATHMAGNKHKSKASKRERGDDETVDGEPPQKKPCYDEQGNEIPKKPKKKKKKKKAAAAGEATATGLLT